MIPGQQKKKAKFTKPPNIFKKKVGSGGINEVLLVKSQEAIDKSAFDFTPYARQFLEQIAAAVKAAKSKDDVKDAKEKLIAPIMQLKANGGMFRYQLLSDIANIALQFLESVEEINGDTFDVIKAHENTLKIIITNKLLGRGGREGTALITELENACQRYFTKYGKKDGTV